MREDQGLTVRDILNVIYKRILILKLVVILVPLGVLIACLVASPVYQVGAKVIVTAKKDEAAILAPTGPGPSRVLNLNVDEIDQNSEMEILKSPDLWTKTVRELGPDFFKRETGGIIRKIFGELKDLTGLFESGKEPKKEENFELSWERAIATSLMRNFEVIPVPRSKVLDLTFKDSDPDRVQKILSKLLDVYIPYHTQVYSVPGALVFFSEQLVVAKAKFDLARKTLTEFRKKWNLSVTERQEIELTTSLKMIEDATIEINSNLDQYQKMLALLDKGNMPTGQLAPGTQRNLENTMINVMGVQLLQAGQKRLQVSEIFAPASRDYRIAEEQFIDVYSKFKSAMASESSILEIKKASLQESQKRILEQMQVMIQRGEELKALQLDLAVARERYLQFLAKEQEAALEGTERRKELVDVKILGRPWVPSTPISPKTGLYVLLSFIFSFPLGIGIIFLASFLDHSFDDPSRLEAATGYKVLATFGKIKGEESPPGKGDEGQPL
jgi:uncharacterized protein involved in exopolysaccharide biosynthesis